MQSYNRFIFDSYDLDISNHTIKLNYSLDDQINFTENLLLPSSLNLEQPNSIVTAALFGLHLAGGVSYYKLFLPKTIEIRSGELSHQQADFWNALYRHGLGEFFYHNNIDFRDLIHFPVTATTEIQQTTITRVGVPKRALVPFGGGKDSIVTSELLKTRGIPQTLFRVRSHPFITKLAQTANLQLLEIERILDPQLTKLNAAGAYNGHVPVTAYISFLSVVTALLGGYDAVIFSNERSSSYGNLDYLGMTINHQWSKGLEFETSMRTYISNYITPSVAYDNLLRDTSELKIAKLFSQYPQYFEQATSCNRNWTILSTMPDTSRWCGKCPKCAFSFALFSAYLPASELIKMFGLNLLENQMLLPLYQELWGEKGFKPFECVGTPEETQAALYLAGKNPDFASSFIIRAFNASSLPNISHPEQLVSGLLSTEPKL